MGEAALFILGVLAITALAVAVGRAFVKAPRCPRCGSAHAECQGEWDGLEFLKCRRCGALWEVSYRREEK